MECPNKIVQLRIGRILSPLREHVLLLPCHCLNSDNMGQSQMASIGALIDHLVRERVVDELEDDGIGGLEVRNIEIFSLYVCSFLLCHKSCPMLCDYSGTE